MKLIFCSDLHGNKRLYKKLFEYSKEHEIENIIIGGDICPHAHLTLQEGIQFQRGFIQDFLIPFLRKLTDNNIQTYIMMGNDDFKVNIDLLIAADKQGITNLIHKNPKKLDGLTIIGYSFVNQMPFLLKDWEKKDTKTSRSLTNPEEDIRTVKKEKCTIEEDFVEIKKMSDPKKTIYCIHAPPFNTRLDVIHGNRHVGSKAIRDFIEKEQPMLTLHGHIHESYEVSGYWKETISTTQCINPGSNHLNSRLNIVVIDLKDLNNIKFLEV